MKSATPNDIERFLVGQEITYSFVITNTGNVTLTDVVPVEGDFSGSGELGPITPGPVTLAPAEQATFSATYILTQADIDAGSLRNTAIATGVPPTGPPVEAPPTEVEIPTPAIPALSIVKSADKKQIVSAGETILYSFVVTNTGNVTVTDVAPVEVEFSGTGKLGDLVPASAEALLPGQSATFTAEYVTTQADVDAGGVTNTATATGTPPGGAEMPPVPPSDVTVPSVPAPGLTVVKTADVKQITRVGQVVTYTFLVENVGNVTMANVRPVEGSFSGTGTLGPITPRSVSLAPAEKATFTATYSVTAADLESGQLENTATVEGTPPGGGVVEGPPSTAKVPVVPAPGLPITGAAGITGLAVMAALTITAGGYLLLRRRKAQLG